MTKKIAFLDRDGTLIHEPPPEETAPGDVPYQIDDVKKLKILPGVIEGLQALQQEGYELVLISNQDGVGTDIFPEKNFAAPQNKFLDIFKGREVEFAEIFICPHKAEDNCDCRKPKTGLVDDFLQKNKINYEQSFVLGDRDSDTEFANNIGVAAFSMQTNGSFPRMGFVNRKTSETDISVACNLDGKGIYKIKTGIGFFDHMLEQISRHSLIDLSLSAKGDLQVDKHHTVEDVAIALGEALSKALGQRK